MLKKFSKYKKSEIIWKDYKPIMENLLDQILYKSRFH